MVNLFRGFIISMRSTATYRNGRETGLLPNLTGAKFFVAPLFPLNAGELWHTFQRTEDGCGDQLDVNTQEGTDGIAPCFARKNESCC